MDPEIIQRLNEQFREMAELLSQQNATMAAQLKSMQAQNSATAAGANARTNEQNAIQRNTNTIGENTRKQEAYASVEEQREKQRAELHASFRNAMQGTINSLTSFKDALLGTERGFAKYGNTISGLGDAAWDLGKNFGILGGALGGLAKGVGMAAGAVLQQTDNMNNFADTFKNMGAVGGTTNTKLLEMAQAAGYASQDLTRLAKPIATLGAAITNIGGTAQAGQQAFMNIINIGEDARKKFNRLGMQIEDVNDAQANYIALQRLSGNAFSNSAKDQDKLRKTSLEYTENLVELAALTGTDIETLKKKQQIAYQEYQELVTTQAENARIAELRKKVAETGDKDLAAELKRLEARAAARDQVKQETDELFGGAMGAQIRDYLRSGGRVSETNIGAVQLAGKELEQLRKMYESGASKEEMSKFMRENLRQAMKEGVGERATQFGGTVNVLDPRAAEELGNMFGLDKELMTKLAALGEKPAAQAAQEAEAGVKTAGEEGFDKAADARAALTELEIKAKVELDKLLLTINPLANGFDAGKIAAYALAAAATGAAIALGRMALASRMGGMPGRGAPGGGRPGAAPGGGAAPSTAAEKRAASKAAAKEAAIAEARAAKGAAAAGETAAGASKLGKLGGLAKGAGRILGKLAWPLTAGMALYDAYKGFNADSGASFGGKLLNAGSSALSGATFGLLGSSPEEIAAQNAKQQTATPPEAQQTEQAKAQNDQFNKAVASFGSLITSFAKTVTAFAVTTKAFAMSTKRFAETVNKLTKITSISSKAGSIDRRNSALDGLISGTLNEAEEALTPMESFQKSLSNSANMMKYLREEELKRHRFNELSMSQFRKSVEDAAKKLDKISGTTKDNDGATPAPGGDGGGGEGATGASSDNAKKAMQYFMSQGWTKEQAAGIVGNLQAESGVDLDTTAISKNDAGLGKHSYGIAQWNRGRFENLKKFADKRGTTWEDFDTQLAFIQHELTKGDERGAGRKLREATDATTAAKIVDKHYERSTGEHIGKRIANAKALASDSQAEGAPIDIKGQDKNIVALGKQLQSQGLRVAEHPAFGGVSPVHKGRGHYEARAIDVNVGKGINESKDPRHRARFDQIAESARSAGFKVIWRGIGGSGHYSHMHIESPRNASLKAKKGGVFDGPDSGYPVELHGGEMITPLNMDSILMKLAKTPANTPAGDTLEKMVQGPQMGANDSVDKIMQMHSELIDVLSRKLDNMLDKLDDGNDTRQKILKNSQT